MLCFPRSVTPGFCFGAAQGARAAAPTTVMADDSPHTSWSKQSADPEDHPSDDKHRPQPAGLDLGRKLLPAESATAVPQDEQIHDPEAESQQEH